MKSPEDTFIMYYNGAYQYLRGLCANEELARKLAMDTFLRASIFINNYHGEVNIKAWLSSIIKKQYMLHLRKLNSFSGDKLQKYLNEEKANFCKMFQDKDFADRLYPILKNLPDPFREVYMLRVFGDMNFNQIGNVEQKSVHWACTVYYRAWLMIQDRMEAAEN